MFVYILLPAPISYVGRYDMKAYLFKNFHCLKSFTFFTRNNILMLTCESVFFSLEMLFGQQPPIFNSSDP